MSVHLLGLDTLAVMLGKSIPCTAVARPRIHLSTLHGVAMYSGRSSVVVDLEVRCNFGRCANGIVDMRERINNVFLQEVADVYTLVLCTAMLFGELVVQMHPHRGHEDCVVGDIGGSECLAVC